MYGGIGLLLVLSWDSGSSAYLILSLWRMERRVGLFLMLSLKQFLKLRHLLRIAALTEVLKGVNFGSRIFGISG